MSEPIFRAWDKDRNKWLENFSVDNYGSIFRIEFGEEAYYHNAVLCRSTGLKDKHGKMIFECDIIKLCNNNNGYLEVIFKNQYVGGWLLFNKNLSADYLSLGARKESELEIIGNIFQNKELLEQKQNG